MFIPKYYGVYEFLTKNFIVRFEAVEESAEVQIQEMDTELAEKISSKIDSGEYVCFSANIYVLWRETEEELAASYLGGNIHENHESFMDHFGLGYTSLVNKLNKETDPNKIKELQKSVSFFEKQGRSCFGSYFKDLVNEVIEEARNSDTYKHYKNTFQTQRRIKVF